MQGVDEGYSDSVGYGFGATAKGYGSAREIWKALQTEDAVVISSDLAPERNPHLWFSTALYPLLSTKLRPSQYHPSLVARPRLTEKLDPEAGRRLTLVSAPEGFGKTTSAPAGGKIVLEVNWDDARC